MEEQGEPKQLYIIIGLSGAGKSTVLRVFEDMRYFAVDGLPAGLAPEVAEIMDRRPMRHFPGMAIGMDLRQDDFLEQYEAALAKLKARHLDIRIIFLEADVSTLVRRYAATRRPHPLEISGLGLESAIKEEIRLLAPIRSTADMIIDSSDYSIHDLRRVIQRLVRQEDSHCHSMKVIVVSFGFKYGLPGDADFVFDLRFLDNPYFMENLRPLSGKDKAVADYIFNGKSARAFKGKLQDLLFFCLDQMEAEGRYRTTIAFGCTGGRHRSVAMAEEIAQALRQAAWPVTIDHKHLDMDVRQR